LHDIISNTKKDEVKIRAISELHSIEMDLFNLWKQLPDLDIVDQERKSSATNHEVPPVDYREPIVGYDTEPWGSGIDDKPKAKPEEKPIEIAAPIVCASHELTEKQELKDGEGEGWKLLKCPTCDKSFYDIYSICRRRTSSFFILVTGNLSRAFGRLYYLLSYSIKYFTRWR
jgi:hypothetical protein